MRKAYKALVSSNNKISKVQKEQKEASEGRTRSAERSEKRRTHENYDVISYIIQRLCQMGACRGASVVILRTGQCKFSQERGYIVKFWYGIYG